MGATIAAHDLDMKVRQTRKFIEQGHRVKLCIMVRPPARACLPWCSPACSRPACPCCAPLTGGVLVDRKRSGVLRRRVPGWELLQLPMLQLHRFAVPAEARHAQVG